ncbi:MAG TPA: hypothetical protein VLV50_18160 [Stellaceae bacterium]|nr:hypothetical protein [Stellaceae bacterium]
MKDFQERFSEALRKRLYPNTNLHLKEIALAVGRAENTVARWWRGETRILGEDLGNLARFFHRRGDTKFLSELFGEFVAQDASPTFDEATAVALVRAVLSGKVEGRAVTEQHSWFTADGSHEAAPAGHAEYVRRALNMGSPAGNLIDYATRVLGWIGVVERSDGSIIVRHDGRRISALAAERACEWLEDRNDTAVRVRRMVHVDGAWIEAEHSGARAAAFAIGKAAFIVRVRRMPWTVQRLRLDSVADPRQIALLQVANASPEKLLHAAAEMGAFTTTSVFRIDGENVVSHHVATGFGFDTSVVEGLNVLARPDTDYALMVQARMLRTKREGPEFSELSGTIDDIYVKYMNLALPEPGPDGRVLSATVMLTKEQRAA